LIRRLVCFYATTRPVDGAGGIVCVPCGGRILLLYQLSYFYVLSIIPSVETRLLYAQLHAVFSLAHPRCARKEFCSGSFYSSGDFCQTDYLNRLSQRSVRNFQDW